MTGAESLRFGEFELRLSPLGLSKAGAAVSLQLQPLRLLALLARRSGELVTHEQIRQALWNGRTVDFSRSVPVCVRQIRAALGDDAERPRYVETLPRQGYRFLPPVQRATVPIGEAQAQSQPLLTPRRALIGTALAGAAVAGLLSLWQVTGSRFATDSQASAARDLYLRGLYLLDKGDGALVEKSIRYLLGALADDAGYAPAHVALAKAYRKIGKLEDSKLHALKAVVLDPGSAEAHLQVAICLMHHDWNWEAAGRHIERSLALDPSVSEAHHISAGRHAILGDFRAALEAMEKARALDPVSTLLRADHGWFHYFAGDYDRALARCREALDLDAKHVPSLLCLERAAEAKGDLAAAREAALRLMKLWNASTEEQAKVATLAAAEGPRAFHAWRLHFFLNHPKRDAISPEDIADASAAAGEHEAAMTHLERAADMRAMLLPYMLADPIFKALHRDPRFAALRGRLNIPSAARD